MTGIPRRTLRLILLSLVEDIILILTYYSLLRGNEIKEKTRCATRRLAVLTSPVRARGCFHRHTKNDRARDDSADPNTVPGTVCYKSTCTVQYQALVRKYARLHASPHALAAFTLFTMAHGHRMIFVSSELLLLVLVVLVLATPKLQFLSSHTALSNTPKPNFPPCI